MEWIEIAKYGFPKEDGNYMVYGKIKYDNGSFAEYKNYGWYSQERGWVHVSLNISQHITHWMRVGSPIAYLPDQTINGTDTVTLKRVADGLRAIADGLESCLVRTCTYKIAYDYWDGPEGRMPTGWVDLELNMKYRQQPPSSEKSADDLAWSGKK